MGSWKHKVFSKKGKGKQLTASECDLAGQASASSANHPIAEGEQRPSVALEEPSLRLTPVGSGPGPTSATPPAPASSSVHLAPQSVETFGLFELPRQDPLPADSRLTSSNARQVDVVAVHGLGGNWKSTWTAEDGAMWLRDRLPSILAEVNVVARVLSFGYDSGTVFTSSITDLQTAARILLARLRGSRRTQQRRSAPIIFVCHSLGGLVVKEALVQAWNRSSDNQNILEKARACLFLGVPHRGSGLADWANVPAKLVKTLSVGFAGNSNFVSVLRSSSKDWVRLSDNFVERANNIYFRSFFETTKCGNLIVVDEGSAAMHISNEQVIPLEDSNHQTICKFRKNENQRFSLLGNAILELAELTLPPREEVESQHISIRCRERFPTATHTFFGRESELRALEVALDPAKAGQKGMVLYGLPGAGKTQLALQYAERHRELFTSTFWITASSPESISSSFSAAAALIASSWPAQDLPNPCRDEDGVQKVISRLRSTAHRNWLLVIDSADNVQEQDFTKYVPTCQYGSILVTSTRREAVDVFRMESLEIGSLDPDNGLQLLLARARNSRNLVPSGVPTMTEDEIAAKAIAKELDYLPLAIEYAAALVQGNRFSLKTFKSGYQQHYQRLAKETLPKGLVKYEKSVCLFTLIGMLYSTVQEKSPDAAALLTLLAFLGPWRFPLALFRPSLQGSHGRTHDTLVMRLDNTHLKAILTDDILLSLAVSHLSDTCLVKTTGNPMTVESVSVHNIVCQWIFETTAEKDQWILAAAAQLSAHALVSQKNFRGILFPCLTTQEFGRLHLAPLSRCASLLRTYTNPVELTALSDCYAPLRGDLESSLALANLQDGRLNAAKTHFQHAIERLQLQQGDTWPSGEAAICLLYGLAITYQRERDTAAAAEVLKSVLELALRTFDEFDDRIVEITARSKAVADRAELNLRHHKAALLAATAGDRPKPRPEPQPKSGHAEIVDERHNHGASVNIYGTALQEASAGGRMEIVKTLLDEEGGYFGTALQAASANGHTELVEKLLDRGADINKEGGYYGTDGWTPLGAASTNGHVEVVKVLLDNGADVAVPNKSGSAPLIRASTYGHVEVVKVLLDNGADVAVADSEGWTSDRGFH
ncbi:hypothetical protein PCL_09587 [Purpureocillium lilacinum]|uniref:Orc1-like AAA ATPase domain-containing protein n=1 Tax=Purpureocillium lilacinum TaxID=33203 RepID=A0A2U3DQH4_PURLI|nr:hypothetical protein PCL_09587 [Purpureocillium lilacinum]